MATRAATATLVAALGAFGPRARAFALQGQDVRDIRASRGMGASLGITDPYTMATEEILKAVGSIGGEVVPIAAAFGNKGAAKVMAEQSATTAAQAQAAQSAVAGQVAVANAASWSESIKALAPWFGGALLLGVAAWGGSRLISARRAAPKASPSSVPASTSTTEKRPNRWTRRRAA